MIGNGFESGTELSGDEWQRLAIARSLVTHPKLLILDEPTSALDPLGEEKVFKMLSEKYADESHSLLFVSHRFSTLRKSKRIIVVDNGKIVEDGTHVDLLAHSGLYAKMFSTQAEGYR